MADYVGALDQGTTSTRFMIFDHAGEVVGIDQKEHEQIFPKPGWVEHDANEVWTRSQEVIDGALAKNNLSAADIGLQGLEQLGDAVDEIGDPGGPDVPLALLPRSGPGKPTPTACTFPCCATPSTSRR